MPTGYEKFLARKVGEARQKQSEAARLRNLIADRTLEAKLAEMGLPSYANGTYKGPDAEAWREIEPKPEAPEPLDAMALGGQDVATLLRARGIEPADALPHGMTSTPQRPKVDPRVQARLDSMREEERERAEQDAARLKENAIDFRAASVTEAAHRLAQLGIDPSVARGFKSPPAPTPPPEKMPMDSATARAAAEGRARKTLSGKLRRAEAAHRPVDAAKLSPFEYAELLRRRGLDRPRWEERPDRSAASRPGWSPDVPLAPSKE